jgi:hypothetical protein
MRIIEDSTERKQLSREALCNVTNESIEEGYAREISELY